MEKNKQIFFVTTFGSIYRRVLPLIEEKKKNGEIIVVATTEQIAKFFENYTEYTVIRLRVHPDLITKKTWYKLFSNIIKSKLEYDRLFKNLKGNDIYFFGSAYAIVVYSYIQKLSRHNSIHQYSNNWGLVKPQIDYLKKITKDDNILKQLQCVDTRRHVIHKTPLAYLMRLFTKLFFNLDTIVFSFIVSDKSFSSFVLNENFYHKNHVHIEPDYSPDYHILDKYMTKDKQTEDKNILIPIEDLVACAHVEEDAFVKKLDKIVESLCKYQPNVMIVKPHPRLSTLYGKMQDMPKLPSYIPAEFIYKKEWEFIIGIESNALIEASKQTDSKVISLINLITYKDPETQKKWKDWLQTESNNRIIFPSDLEELESLLKPNKNKQLL